MIVIGGVLSQLVLAQATPWFAEIAETAVYKMSRIRMLIARGHHHDFFVLTMGLISHSRYPGPGGRNSTRKGKTLWANADDKDPVVGITAFPFKRSIKKRLRLCADTELPSSATYATNRPLSDNANEKTRCSAVTLSLSAFIGRLRSVR